MQGQLSAVAVADVLATVEASGKSAEVRVQGELDCGTVWVREGRLIDARMGSLSGESACRALLAIDAGTFEVQHCEVDRPAAIRLTVKQLTARASHRSSSWARLVTKSPGLTTVLEVNPAVYGDFQWVLEPGEQELAGLVDGTRTIEDLIACFGRDPVDTLRRIVNLVDGGLFRKASPGPAVGPPAVAAIAQDNPSAEAPDARPVSKGLLSRAPAKPSPSGAASKSRPPSSEPEAGSRYSVRPGAVDVLPHSRGAVPGSGIGLRFAGALRRTATLVGTGPPAAPPKEIACPDSEAAHPREEAARPSVVPQRTISVDGAVPTVVIPRSGVPPELTTNRAHSAAASVVAAQADGFVGNVSSQPLFLAAGSTPTAEQAFLGRYQVLCRIGRGGMGSVYLCRITGEAGFRRLFALKVLRRKLKDDPESVQLFLQEARVAARVHHPNVVAVLDASVHGTQPYLVMDYVEGCSLHTLLERNPTYRPPELVLPIILDALNGLRSIHLLTREDGLPVGLVHCDVSPDNLLVGVDGACRISDFGIARMSGGSPAASSRGKLAYLAPERVAGGLVDQRADVYSLGVVLYNALTGVQLFQSATAEETLRNIERAQVVPPSQVGLRPPAYLDPICMRALARDVAVRYASADEMMYELSRAMARHEVVARVGDVAEWVRRTVGPDLEMRRLATLDGSQRFGGNRPRAALASMPPGTSAGAYPPPSPDGPSANPRPASSIAQPVDTSDDGTGAPPNWRKTVLVAASALAVLAVVVSMLWPAVVGRMFSIDKGTMPISVEDQSTSVQLPGLIPPTAAEPRLTPLSSSAAPPPAPPSLPRPVPEPAAQSRLQAPVRATAAGAVGRSTTNPTTQKPLGPAALTTPRVTKPKNTAPPAQENGAFSREKPSGTGAHEAETPALVESSQPAGEER